MAAEQAVVALSDEEVQTLRASASTAPGSYDPLKADWPDSMT